MYIHRVVIDANRINTRGAISAMNHLEALHDAGLIEIFQTSTLPIEFRSWPRGQAKAHQYAVIGGSSMVYLTNGHVADSVPGTSGRNSRLMEIHQSVFGDPASIEDDRVSNMRDALHIDQANQHDTDFFVTDDRAILHAAPALATIGIGTHVCPAEDCLAEITKYFIRTYGTSDPMPLAQRLTQEGPILLGSNSCGGTALTDLASGEILLAFERTDTGVGIRAIIRDEDGEKLLTIVPGQPLLFDCPGADVRMEVGPAPLLLGDEHCRSFTITARGQQVLAARVLRRGRMLVHHASLRNSSGQLVFKIARDVLETSGGTIAAYPSP